MASTSNSRETELKTSSAEERTRTFDVPLASRSRVAPGPAPGDVLRNRFVLHQCLAEGSTSRLFRAMDRSLEAAGEADPWVVLKVVTVVDSGEAQGHPPRALQALRREAAIAQGLDHPNLPRIIGIDHDGPHTFLCMAWLEGESLAAILDGRGSRPMTRVQSLHILDGVARALAHVHGLGITHADVKPGNILVTSRGEATLLDFGVALGPGAGDLPAARGHTPEYASPQVLAGQDPTPSDDLFSLACVAYRMLAGHRAFGAETAREAEAAGRRPPRPEHLSPAQWRALDRGLAFARADRQADVASFMAQLKGARDETGAATDAFPVDPAPPPTAAASDDKPRRRTGFLVGIGAVVALVFIAGTLVLLENREPAPVPATARPDAKLPDPPPPGTNPLAASPDDAPIPGDEPVTPPPSPGLPGAPPVPAGPPVAAVTEAPPKPPVVPRPPATGRATASRMTPAAGSAPVEPAGPPVPEPAEAPPTPDQGPAASADQPGTLRSVAFSSLTVRRYVEPDYPRNAAARRVEGWVDVAFVVEESGKTRDAQVVAADPPDIFDAAALAAVRRWRFAEVAEPVGSQIRVRFDPSR